jgi:hypothetical protein
MPACDRKHASDREHVFKDAAMLNLSHWIYVPVLLYSSIGIFMLRQSLRPSCRICLHRHRCPNRLRGSRRFIELPPCIRTNFGNSVEEVETSTKIDFMVSPTWKFINRKLKIL